MKSTHSPISLESIAALTSSKLKGKPQHTINGVADLEDATFADAAFYSSIKYLDAFLKSNAGVIFVDSKANLMEGKNYLISDDPSQSFQRLIDYFYPFNPFPSGFEGIHPTAVIHHTAHIGDNVVIGPHAVIDAHAIIGNHTFIGAGAYVGQKARIGSYCLIHPRVVIREECTIGNSVIIQPGAVIGSCGFGYKMDAKGNHIKLNQVGNVIIEDQVEIGANTTIDRARFKCTTIGKGTKIDNLVHIAHNVKIGVHNIMLAQSAIAGSSSTGSHVIIAGQSCVLDHVKITDRTIVMTKSLVTKSLPTKANYSGIPAISSAMHNRNQVYLRNIEKYIKQIKELQVLVSQIQQQLDNTK